MRQIYKYSLDMFQPTTILTGTNPEIVLFARDGNMDMCVWINHINGSHTGRIVLSIIGTGTMYNAAKWKHVASFIDLPFVWHLLKEGDY